MHWKNKWSEVSIVCKHKEHIDTIAHPRAQRFSSVGILPWASLQKVKEWDGGIQGFQIKDAQWIIVFRGLRKEKASLAVSLPSEAKGHVSTSGRTTFGSTMEFKHKATTETELTSKGTLKAPLEITSETKPVKLIYTKGSICKISTKGFHQSSFLYLYYIYRKLHVLAFWADFSLSKITLSFQYKYHI